MNNDFQYWTRRILAFIVTPTAIGVLAKMSLSGDEKALIALVTMSSMIIAFYFGTRSS